MKYSSFIAVLVCGLLPASIALGYTPLIELPGLPDGGTIDFSAYINALIRLAIIIAALIAVVKLILAGIQYVLDDVVTRKEDAKANIKKCYLWTPDCNIGSHNFNDY